MNRPSAKQEVAAAALRVAARVGLTALTYEAVAAESGKSKGGVLYHFPTRDDLARAVIERLIGLWEADAERHLGAPFAAASVADRRAAYLLSAIDTSGELDPLGDLSALVDVMHDPALAAIWTAFRDRWVGDISALTTTQQIALAAADGIWVDEAMQQAPYPASSRDAVVAELLRMIRGD
ncbi:TetR family transcriptional regulator [Microbacterium excoecariae]|uniref:TetR family transcriptional regulator n=1 Tax=Microbacterium excoecariae TaxID=2715210 RepID=UPI0014081553|nr:TetR family transcriptional regulator [Microbacterium excoecariae]NHI16071.1 helix-turn-helix transcriptional regulator [Microbacterium excoecariae]